MNKVDSSSYQSSYITNKNPKLYGGKQAEYLELAEKAIDLGLNTIIDEMKQKVDPTLIYHKTIKALQNARNDICVQHQPHLSDVFGVRRDESKEFHHAHTLLIDSHYAEYNEKYNNHLAEILHQIPHDLKTFHKKTITVHETVMNMKYSFEVELLDISDMDTQKFNQNPTDKELCAALKTNNVTNGKLFDDVELMKKLKKDNKVLYDRVIMTSLMATLNAKFPSPNNKNIDKKVFSRHEYKNIYVIGTIRLELEKGLMFCLSKRVSWMYQDWVQDPIDRMKAHSNVYVIHQDPFLIERTQQACAKLFADAIKWDKNTSTLDALMEKVALFRFVYGNSMPCGRGDGATGDWAELDIYRYHGFTNTQHNKDVLPCIELLATPKISQYLEAYKKTITVC